MSTWSIHVHCDEHDNDEHFATGKLAKEAFVNSCSERSDDMSLMFLGHARITREDMVIREFKFTDYYLYSPDSLMEQAAFDHFGELD